MTLNTDTFARDMFCKAEDKHFAEMNRIADMCEMALTKSEDKLFVTRSVMALQAAHRLEDFLRLMWLEASGGKIELDTISPDEYQEVLTKVVGQIAAKLIHNFSRRKITQ